MASWKLSFDVELNPESFLLLLDATRSPLMFDVLAARMLFYSWSESLLLSVLKSNLLYVWLLCARWMFSLVRDGKLSNKQVLETLAQLTPQKRSLQAAYFLSQIMFFVRTKHTLEADGIEKWEQLYCQLLSHLAPTFHTAQSKSRTRHYYFGCTTVNNAHSACYNWISPNTSKIR